MSIRVRQGVLRGIVNKSVLSGKPYYSFLGIPYAKPPLGNLRFQPPQPATDPWKGVYDATYEREPSVQISKFLLYGLVGSEDCLHLNVYTPEDPSEIKKPKAVMVFFHGGAFASGTGSRRLYSPDYFLQKDVIVATVNYRLSILGFLNLHLENCRGNAGLKDQVMALSWIKDNIAEFGGDSENITIFGHSAGSTSVHYHIISPASRGLFHKAILQSGFSLSPWALTYKPLMMASVVCFKLGFRGVGGGDHHPEELLAFLKKRPAEELIEGTMNVEKDLTKRYPGVCFAKPFLPSVEKFEEDAFLTDIPEKLLHTAQPIPIIFGLNDKESMYLFNVRLNKETIESISRDFSNVVKYNFKIEPSRVDEVSAKIKNFYFGDKEIGDETAKEALVDLYTDIMFFRYYESIEFIIKSNVPAYLYQFQYDGRYNTVKRFCSNKNIQIRGASHGDELGYQFLHEILPRKPEYTEHDLRVIENITTLWTNFAKSTDPTSNFSEIKWRPSTAKEICYLTIDNDLKMNDGKMNQKRIQFWKELFETTEGIYEALI